MKRNGIWRHLLGMVLCIILLGTAVVWSGQQQPVQAAQEATLTNLIVFVRFNGDEEFVNKPCKGDDATVGEVVENSYNRAEYSVTDYYFRVSNGKARIQNLYLFNADGSSITLEHSRGYYCTADTTNAEGYAEEERYTRMYELKQDWSNAIMTALTDGAQVCNADGTKTYDLAELDKNGDGYLDSLTIIYPYSNQYSVSWKDCLWDYQDFYNGVTFSVGGKQIQTGNYLQFTANFNYLYTDAQGRSIANMKTMIHEMGHIFGLKDLYRSGSETPVYYMSAMAQAISPIPQYLSAKEREALGWLESSNVQKIRSAGTYRLHVTADSPTDAVICYKFDLADKNKTIYLEYRKFDGDSNRYDTQQKAVYNEGGAQISGISLKSGLLCFMVDRDTTFPNNMYTTGSNWNYQVLGGNYGTKSDAALAPGESLLLALDLEVKVVSIEGDWLTFQLVGTGIRQDHTHAPEKILYKAPTCTEQGNIEYWHCADCGSFFRDERLQQPISQAATQLPAAHSPTTVKGYAATCHSKGLSDGSRCLECGTVLTEQQELTMLPHSSSGWILDKAATAEEPGRRHKECLACRQLLAEETLIYQGKPEQTPPTTAGVPTAPPTVPPSTGATEPPTVPPPSTDGTQPSRPSVGETLPSPTVGTEPTLPTAGETQPNPTGDGKAPSDGDRRKQVATVVCAVGAGTAVSVGGIWLWLLRKRGKP